MHDNFTPEQENQLPFFINLAWDTTNDIELKLLDGGL